MDNSRQCALVILAGSGYAGDAATYEKMVKMLEFAIRTERDGVLEENLQVREAWADSPDAEAFSRELARSLLARWEHVNDE